MDALTLDRAARRMAAAGFPTLSSVLRVAMRVGFGAYVDPTANISARCELGYGGLGVVIGADVIVGERTFISHNVTVARRVPTEPAPRIGAYVYLGAGAQVVGDVTIEDFAVIGANAVVEDDVAKGAIVAGHPARELRRISDPIAQYELETGERVLLRAEVLESNGP
jgi:serine O-acetyltransferase